jgi:hypothetical protein
MTENKNLGLERVGGGADADGAITLIVLGVSRGGTSAAAGILGQLGVYMGNSGKPPMYEDLYLNKAILQDRELDYSNRIEEYNHAHMIWGYKGVVLNRNLSHYHRFFRNPRYLVVFRDLLAIASRARISAGHSVTKIIARQLNEYRRIMAFIEKDSPTAILVSYEKLLLHPAAIVENIAEFAGLEASENDIVRAAAHISANPADYPQIFEPE